MWFAYAKSVIFYIFLFSSLLLLRWCKHILTIHFNFHFIFKEPSIHNVVVVGKKSANNNSTFPLFIRKFIDLSLSICVAICRRTRFNEIDKRCSAPHSFVFDFNFNLFEFCLVSQFSVSLHHGNSLSTTLKWHFYWLQFTFQADRWNILISNFID